MRAIGFLCLAGYVLGWVATLVCGIGAWSNRRPGVGLFDLHPRFTPEGNRLRNRAIILFFVMAGFGLAAFLLLTR